MTLRIGKIDYLNIWHIFHLLADTCPEGDDFHYVPGHPSQLNQALDAGLLDISPSSSFEYLLHAEKYRLLPGASISASTQVQSVLFMSPVPLGDLSVWMKNNPGPVCLTGASATSTALVKVLWSQKWELPEPVWQEVEPGQGATTGRPFLEIGNLALRHFIHPPKGYHIYDVAAQWSDWTGLPFVFAVWIVRRDLPEPSRHLVDRLRTEIARITAELDRHVASLSRFPQRPEWLTQTDLLGYWNAIGYALGPREQAGLAFFGERCTRQGLLSGMPTMSWFRS